jgi:hypothetical protein
MDLYQHSLPSGSATAPDWVGSQPGRAHYLESELAAFDADIETARKGSFSQAAVVMRARRRGRLGHALGSLT